MSVWWPAAIAAQPAAWACVGASNVLANQARTGALNGASGSLGDPSAEVDWGAGGGGGAVVATGARV